MALECKGFPEEIDVIIDLIKKYLKENDIKSVHEL